MFSLIFNEISGAELAALPKDLQLEILTGFQILLEEPKFARGEHFHTVHREGRMMQCCRVENHRIYLEKVADGILVHRVIPE